MAREAFQRRDQVQRKVIPRSIDLQFELARILVGSSREDHGVPVAEELDQLLRVSGGTGHFAGIRNDPKSPQNIMGIIGAFPGKPLINDVIGLSDVELRAFDEIRKVAFEERQMGVALFCQSIRKRV